MIVLKSTFLNINYNKIHLLLVNFLLITYKTCPKYLNYCIITVIFRILR